MEIGNRMNPSLIGRGSGRRLATNERQDRLLRISLENKEGFLPCVVFTVVIWSSKIEVTYKITVLRCDME